MQRVSVYKWWLPAEVGLHVDAAVTVNACRSASGGLKPAKTHTRTGDSVAVAAAVLVGACQVNDGAPFLDFRRARREVKLESVENWQDVDSSKYNSFMEFQRRLPYKSVIALRV